MQVNPKKYRTKLFILALLILILFFTILYGRTSYQIVEISIKNSN
jgi:hypothetical protein